MVTVFIAVLLSFALADPQLCYQDICKNAPFHIGTYQESQEDRVKLFTVEGTEDLRPLIESVVDQTVAQELKNISDLEQLIQDPDFKLSEDKKVLHSLLFTLLIRNYFVLESSETEPPTLIFNRPLTAASLWFLNADLVNYALKVGEKIAQLHVREIAEELYLPSEILLKKYFPGKSVSEAVRIVATDTETMLWNLEHNKETALISGMQSSIENFRPASQRAALAGRPISADAIVEVIKLNGNVKIYSLIAFNSEFQKLAEEFPQIALVNQIRKSPGREYMKQTLSNPLFVNSTKLTMLQMCGEQYGKNMAYLPTETEAQRARKIEKIVKYLFKRVLRKFPEEAQISLIKTMQQWHFQYPPVTEDFKKSFSAAIKSEVQKSYSSQMTIMGRNLKDPKWKDLLPFMYKEFLGMPGVPAMGLKGINESCMSYQRPPLSDAAYTSDGGIEISWTSMKNESLLRAVMGHEMGHVIEKQLSKFDPTTKLAEKFQKAKACLLAPDRHPDISPSDPEQYFSEDWGDLVGAELTGPHTFNPWCAVMNSSEKLSLENESYDVHSSPLFRLLHFEVGRGKELPPSCDEYAPRFKNCFQ